MDHSEHRTLTMSTEVTQCNDLSDEQRRVLTAVSRGQNVFFSGVAGTGRIKSILIVVDATYTQLLKGNRLL